MVLDGVIGRRGIATYGFLPLALPKPLSPTLSEKGLFNGYNDERTQSA